MALIYLDPFATYGAIADVTKGGWTQSAEYSTTGGRFGLGAVRFPTGSTKYLQKVFTAASGSVIVSFDAKVSAGSAGYMLEFYNNSGADKCLTLANTAADALRILNANDATAVTSDANVLTRGLWHRVEVKAQAGSGSGFVDVWVDGVRFINASGIDFDGGSGTGCDRIRFVNENGAFEWYVGSTVIGDTSGSAPLNDVLGDKRLYVLMPTSDAAVGWTPQGGGASYVEVDDAISGASDEGTTYVTQTAAADAIDRYGHEDLPAGVTGIVCVAVDIEAAKTAAGDLPGSASMKVRIEHSGSTTDSSALTALTTNYERRQAIFPNVPGGTGWTKAQVDAATSGPFMDVP